jgi:uncharacterized protein YqfA (UPF0365 family)
MRTSGQGSGGSVCGSISLTPSGMNLDRTTQNNYMQVNYDDTDVYNEVKSELKSVKSSNFARLASSLSNLRKASRIPSEYDIDARKQGKRRKKKKMNENSIPKSAQLSSTVS